MPFRRTLKNVMRNRTLAEIKVCEATSNEPWGPSTTLMSQIANLTYNRLTFLEVMSMIWKRLGDQGKNWRHVYKSLSLLDYLLKTGSEQVVDYCRENVNHIRALRDFQYVEDGKDLGANIRDRAGQVILLLENDKRYAEEREKMLAARERYALNTGIKVINRTEISKMPEKQQLSTSIPSSGHYENASVKEEQSAKLDSNMEAARPSSVTEEDFQVQMALALSRKEQENLENRYKANLLKIQLAVEESCLALASAEKVKCDQPTKQDSPPRLPPPNPSTWRGQKRSSNLPITTRTYENWSSDALASKPYESDAWPRGPPNSKLSPSDPWSLGQNISKPNALDPWSPCTEACKPYTVSSWPVDAIIGQNDPWGIPTGEAPGQFQESSSVPRSQLPSSLQNHVLPQDDYIGDEFEQLSLSRNRPANCATNSGTLLMQHCTGYHTGISYSATPWDSSNLGSALPPRETQRKEMPVDFLGPSSCLVSLGEIITKIPNLSTSNPFMMMPVTRGQYLASYGVGADQRCLTSFAQQLPSPTQGFQSTYLPSSSAMLPVTGTPTVLLTLTPTGVGPTTPDLSPRSIQSPPTNRLSNNPFL